MNTINTSIDSDYMASVLQVRWEQSSPLTHRRVVGIPASFDELEEMGYSISHDLQTFMNSIEYIIRAYRNLGIEASDVRPENMGYDAHGNLKGFDIDNKMR